MKLSSSTTLKEIKSIFPNSYAHRNIGANLGRLEGYDWIYLNDDFPSENKGYPNTIELKFREGKLFELEYDWSPKYSDDQFRKYTEYKRKYYSLELKN